MRRLNILLVFILALTGFQGAAKAYDQPGSEDALNQDLPAAYGSAKKPALLNQFKQLIGVADAGDGEFLDPDIAFRVTAMQGDNNIVTQWMIADGYYLYKDKISVAAKDAAQITLGELPLPEGKKEEDEYFGKIISIDHDFQANIPIQEIAENTRVVDLLVSYQGCAKAGLCYPPITKNIHVAFADTSGVGTVPARPNNPSGNTNSSSSDFQSAQKRIADTLASGKLLFTVLGFFGLGLLLAFTPCVFPMIPILSSIIVGQGKNISTSKAFSLSLAYVLAMAVTYAAAGVLVGLSGKNIQIWFQNPWVISGFAGIFVVLSLAMFGFYKLQMPNAVQSKLNSISSNQQHGSYAGAGIMGFLSTLIIGPCVTAPLIGALIYITETGDALTGGIALFALSIGMGTPLLIIGTSAGKILPKADAWMGTIQAIFGVLLLALAIWMLDRILPAPVILLLAGVLLLVCAIYLGALDAIKEGASGWAKLYKGIGLIALIYGAILVIGAASGSHSILRPLQGIITQPLTGGTATNTSVVHALRFQQVKGIDGLNVAIQQAVQEGKPVMLDFYAEWCVSCKEMEAFTFTNTRVQKALANFAVLQSDVTANDAQDQALLKQLGLFGPPAILFYDRSGFELHNYRIVGFMSATKFVAHIENFTRAATLARHD